MGTPDAKSFSTLDSASYQFWVVWQLHKALQMDIAGIWWYTWNICDCGLEVILERGTVEEDKQASLYSTHQETYQGLSSAEEIKAHPQLLAQWWKMAHGNDKGSSENKNRNKNKWGENPWD